jgi:TP901 family phage tail tape measure protein
MAETRDVRLRLVIEALNKAGAQLNQVGSQLTQISQKTAQMGAATAAATQKGVQGVNQYSASLERLKGQFAAVGAMADKMIATGLQMTIVGAGLSAAAIFPIATAAKFERTMAAVRAVTKEVGVTFGELSEQAKELGATTRYTAIEAAEGMRFLGMAGFEAKEVFEGIGPALNLAAAGQLSLAEAADISTNILMGLGMQVEDLTHVTDVLAHTAANANTDVRQLGEAFSYAAPYIADAGMSLEEASAALGILANAGVRGSRAGTALRGMLVSLTKVTPTAEKVFKRLGVEITKNASGGVDLVKTLKDMQEAGAAQSDWVDVFRRRFAGLASLISKNVGGLTELSTELLNVDGAAEKMRITLEDNLGGAMIVLKSAVEGLAIAMGNPFQEPLKKLVLTVAVVVREIRDWVKEHKYLTTALIAFVGVLGGLLVALGAVLLPLGLMIKLFKALGPDLLNAGRWLKNFIVNLRATATAAWATSTAVRALGTAIAGLAAVWGIYKIGEMIGTFLSMHEAAAKARESMDRLAKSAKEIGERFKDVEYTQIPEDFSDIPLKGLIDLRRSLSQTVAKWTALQTEAVATMKGAWGPDAERAQKKLWEYNVLLEYASESMRRLKAAIAAKQRQEKEAPEVETEDPEAVKARQKERDKIFKSGEEIRISLIEDTEKRLTVVRDKEISELRKQLVKKVISTEEFAEQSYLIEQKYAKKIIDAYKPIWARREQAIRQIQEKEVELEETKATRKLQVAEAEFTAGLISYDRYMETRKSVTKAKYEETVKLMKKALEDPELSELERRTIELEIKIKEIEGEAEVGDIDAEDLQKQLDVEQQFYEDRKGLKDAYLAATDPEAALEAELAATQAANAAKLTLYAQYIEDEGALRELGAAMEADIERRRTLFAQQQAQMRVELARQSLGYLSSLLSDIYEAGGRELKALFYAERAVAAAEAIVSAYSAANKAMDSPLMKKHPTLAMAYSQLVLSTGIARAAAIMTTAFREARKGGLIEIGKFAKGGAVLVKDAPVTWLKSTPIQRFAEGGSVISSIGESLKKVSVTALPTSPRAAARGPRQLKLPMVPVRLTDQEYVFSPEAVKHYGVKIMESINRRKLQMTDVVSGVRETIRKPPAPSGIVRGPKGIDRVFTYLRDKQFVIRPEAVRHYGSAFLEAMNRRVVDIETLVRPTTKITRAGTVVQRFQEGGMVGGTAGLVSPEVQAIAEGGGGVTINVPVSVAGPVDDPEALAARLQEEVEETAIKVMREQMR